MCFEPINEAAARACKERDVLRKKTAEQEKEILSLKEELQQARSILTEKYEETLELLEAAKSAQGLLQIHLVKVQEERDALEKIVGKFSFNCEYCKHFGVLTGCGFDGPCWECVEPEKCVCGKCKRGSMFEYRGVVMDHG